MRTRRAPLVVPAYRGANIQSQAARPRKSAAAWDMGEAHMRIRTAKPVSRLALTLLASAVLGGCTTFSADGGFGAVRSEARARGLGQDMQWVRNAGDAARA